MGWDDGVAANSECILPPSVDGKGAYMDRYLELARPCAFITATNEHVEESIRLLDAMMDTEMQADLYYGPQNPTEGTGWVYDEENGKINTVTVSDVTVKIRLTATLSSLHQVITFLKTTICPSSVWKRSIIARCMMRPVSSTPILASILQCQV